MNLTLVLVGALLFCVLAYTRLSHPHFPVTAAARIEGRIEVFLLGISFGFMLKHVLLGTPSWVVGVIMIVVSLYCLYGYRRAGIVPTMLPFKLLWQRLVFTVRRWRNKDRG